MFSGSSHVLFHVIVDMRTLVRGVNIISLIESTCLSCLLMTRIPANRMRSSSFLISRILPPHLSSSPASAGSALQVWVSTLETEDSSSSFVSWIFQASRMWLQWWHEPQSCASTSRKPVGGTSLSFRCFWSRRSEKKLKCFCYKKVLIHTNQFIIVTIHCRVV